MIDPASIIDGPLTLRYLIPKPKEDINKVLLLLHGWTGDENTMWIFVRQAYPNSLILAPRGLFTADPSGYGWFKSHQDLDTPVNAYLRSIGELLKLLENWLRKMGFPLFPFEVMGFSQGAALAGVLASLYPDHVRKAAMLAGFLPPDLSSKLQSGSLIGSHIYIAHGRKDEIVPFSRAEEAASILSSAGAGVTFCPSNAGHKLSLECSRGLKDFFAP